MQPFPPFIRRLRNAGGLAAVMTAALPGFGAAAGAGAGAPDSYFEQPVADSNPLRIAQAREYEAYIRTLQQDPGQLRAVFQPDYSSVAAYVRSTGSYRAAFCQSIGYPCPGAQPDEPPQFEPIGEDGIGMYYRATIAVLPGIHAEGIYILPKARTGPVPLVIAQHGGAGSPEQALFHGGANYHDMIRGAVKRGYAVFGPQLLFSSPGLAKTNRIETDRPTQQDVEAADDLRHLHRRDGRAGEP